MKRNVNPKQEDGKITRTLYDSWCHQCKMKHEKIVVCDHFWDEDRSTKCNGRYCMNCCKRHYGDDLNSLESLENWICYRCSDKCVCAACRRVRNGESNPPNKNGLIQKGKRKRNNNKAKVVEEDDLDESEEEFYPTKFEKNLRSRRKNDNTTINTKKKSVSPKNVSLKNNSPPTSPKKSKIEHPKIDIPEEDLHGNSMFDILLQVSTLESMRSVDNNNNAKHNPIVPTTNNIFNNFPTNKMNNSALNISPLRNFPNSLPLNNILPPLSKIMNPNSNNNSNNDPKKNEQIQKLLKYDSVLSNPLHPSSYNSIIQLRQEVTVLTTELKNMRQDFSKLQRIFESYIQTHEGSHESSPISSSNYDIPHFNIPLDNLQSNNN